MVRLIAPLLQDKKVDPAVVFFLDYEIGMLTTVLVGSSNTFMFEGYMVTPRGYTNKYDASGEVLPGQRPGYSLVLPTSEAE